MNPVDFGVWTGLAIFLVTPSGRAGCRYIARAVFGYFRDIWCGLKAVARLLRGAVLDDRGVDVESGQIALRENIGILRFARAVQLAAMAVHVFVIWLDVARLHMYALAGVPVAVIFALAAMAVFTTRVIRIRRAQLCAMEAEMRRPNWAAIDRMDREIFGHTFDHGRSASPGPTAATH